MAQAPRPHTPTPTRADEIFDKRRVEAGGHHIEGELWLLPPARLGAFLAALPAPMTLGKLQLDDGSTVTGFLCEPYAAADADDISHYGGWRAYRSSLTDRTRA